MDLPGVSIADDGDTSMFSLRTIHRTPVCGAGGGQAPRASGARTVVGTQLMDCSL